MLQGAGAWRSNFTNSSIISDRSIFTAVQPNGISNVTAFEVSLVDFLPSDSTASTSPSCFAGLSNNASTISQCYTIAAPSSGKLTFIKYVGIASSDAFDGIEYKTASDAATQAKELGWDALLAEHTAAWDAVWMESDIEIHSEFFDEVQLAVRASLFNIMTNVRNGSEGHGLGDNSIAPAGLTSDSYEGAIFCECWLCARYRAGADSFFGLQGTLSRGCSPRSWPCSPISRRASSTSTTANSAARRRTPRTTTSRVRSSRGSLVASVIAQVSDLATTSEFTRT